MQQHTEQAGPLGEAGLHLSLSGRVSVLREGQTGRPQGSTKPRQHSPSQMRPQATAPELACQPGLIAERPDERGAVALGEQLLYGCPGLGVGGGWWVVVGGGCGW